MKQILPHIKIAQDENGRIFLVVDDYELFDFIDDFLSEKCDISYEYQNSTERNGGEIMNMYFPISVSLKEVEENLMRFSADEIENIYRLNN
ncbi:MAG: hypothetical protein V4447_09375 [Pseudomonadota bacterium]